MQIGKVSTPCLRQQVSVNGIGLGTRSGSSTIYRTRIDRIDRPARFQQVCNQEAMRGLNDAGHVLLWQRADDLLQKGVQLGKPLRTVINPKRADLTPLLSNDQGVMMRVGPVDTGISHKKRSSLQTRFLSTRALLLWRSKRDSLMIGSAQEQGQGSANFLNRSSRVEGIDFPWRVQPFHRTSVPWFQPCVERACS